MLSSKFFDALVTTGMPYHKIAWKAGLKPNALYKITSGIDRPGPEDPRIKKLCAYLGLSIEEAFETESEDQNRAHRS